MLTGLVPVRKTVLWTGSYIAVFIWSAIDPKDYYTWFLEVIPALAALVLLALTRKRFAFTPLAYALVLLHCFVLMVGGHYTYAEVPLFDRLSELFNWQRNNYDKVGHFVQGFVPAIVVREILVRHKVVNGKNWLAFVVCSICLAVSAVYELIEWGVALFSPEDAAAFLGTQGYVWDTQSDMALALLGAAGALALLSDLHDRQLSMQASVNLATE
jgi:putative membrane protein